MATTMHMQLTTRMCDKSVPLAVPCLGGNEWNYVKECLDTNWVSSVGPFVDRFEKAVAGYVGADYGIATVNGTAALHLALLLAGVERDDEVLLPSPSFIAPANAVRYIGACPVFVDAEPGYWQMDPQKVADFLDKECRWFDGVLRNTTTGRRVKAILPVHILGHPVDMDPVVAAARKYELAVIEDATESLGAMYGDKEVGTLGDIACFSFNGNKLITTGGGGMIVTDNADWAYRARYLTTQARDDPVEYVHHEVGYNYRLTNIQAAIGCAQMEVVDEYVAAKRRIAGMYTAEFDAVPGIEPMREAPWAFCAYWLYTVRVDESEYGMDSRTLMSKLAESGIQSRPLWQPLHSSPAHSGCRHYGGDVAEELYRNALSIPCSVGLSESDQQMVIETIRSLGPERRCDGVG